MRIKHRLFSIIITNVQNFKIYTTLKPPQEQIFHILKLLCFDLFSSTPTIFKTFRTSVIKMSACFSIFIFSVKCTCTVFILMVVSFFYTFYLGAALQQQCIKHLILCKFFNEIVFQNFVFFVDKSCKVVVNIVWSLVHQNIVYHTVRFYLILYFNKRVLPVKFEMFSG